MLTYAGHAGVAEARGQPRRFASDLDGPAGQHTSAYAAYVSIRPHTSAYVSIRQHTYIGRHTSASDLDGPAGAQRGALLRYTPVY
jgi:hypothetical protein